METVYLFITTPESSRYRMGVPKDKSADRIKSLTNKGYTIHGQRPGNKGDTKITRW